MNRFKFRGQRIDNGEYVYGDVAYTALGVLMGNGFEVDPDSVVLRVGFDNQGREVYQGDVYYHSPEGRPISAELAVILVDNNGQSYYFDKDLLHDVPFSH